MVHRNTVPAARVSLTSFLVSALKTFTPLAKLDTEKAVGADFILPFYSLTSIVNTVAKCLQWRNRNTDPYSIQELQ